MYACIFTGIDKKKCLINFHCNINSHHVTYNEKIFFFLSRGVLD